MSASVNQNYLKLNESYLFAEIARRIREWQSAHPELSSQLIRMGIGDVTRPLPKTVVDAMVKAAQEMGVAETFRGYGPEQGYDFLKTAIQSYYKKFGVELALDEIFISDGAKSDLGNILDLFDENNTVLVTDPVYPVYVDTNMMSGRKIIYAMSSEENGFLPLPAPEYRADIIYLCSPNNPTGAVYDREGLTKWVRFAQENNAILLFDAAYECFVTGDLPHSIYEIPGARDVAIEFCSFSKKAGFTGTRCGYTIVPDTLKRDEPQQDVASPPDHEVQRRELHHPARCRGRLHRGWRAGDRGEPAVLQGQCRHHHRNDGSSPYLLHRWQEFTVHLAQVP